MRATGLVPFGRTTTPEFGVGPVTESQAYGGPTRNPWNLNEGASGSSAGSASATAAGLVGFAIGTETLGSITSPCQRCGTTGLRPTFGRVSRAGAMALCWSLDKIGPICRSVEDTALVLAALNGPDMRDPGSLDVPFNYDAARSLKGVRLGYVSALFEDDGATDVDRAALDAARRIGVELVDVSLPDLPYGSLMSVLFAEAAASFEELTLTNRDDELSWQEPGAWPNAFRKARLLSAVDHVQLDRLRYRVMQVMDEVFQDVDALIGPFMVGPMLVISNFTGHPCLHLRAGFLNTKTRDDPSLADGALHIGVGAHNQAVLAAQLHTTFLQMCAGLGGNRPPHRRRPSKGNPLDQWVFQHLVANFLHAVARTGDDVKHASRNADLFHDLGKEQTTAIRRILGRFQHDGVARRHWKREATPRQDTGKVPGRDDADHPHRHPHCGGKLAMF